MKTKLKNNERNNYSFHKVINHFKLTKLNNNKDTRNMPLKYQIYVEIKQQNTYLKQHLFTLMICIIRQGNGQLIIIISWFTSGKNSHSFQKLLVNKYFID